MHTLDLLLDDVRDDVDCVIRNHGGTFILQRDEDIYGGVPLSKKQAFALVDWARERGYVVKWRGALCVVYLYLEPVRGIIL